METNERIKQMLLSTDIEMVELALNLVKAWTTEQLNDMLEAIGDNVQDREGRNIGVYSNRLNYITQFMYGEGIILFNEEMKWALHRHANYIVFTRSDSDFYLELLSFKWEKIIFEKNS